MSFEVVLVLLGPLTSRFEAQVRKALDGSALFGHEYDIVGLIGLHGGSPGEGTPQDRNPVESWIIQGADREDPSTAPEKEAGSHWLREVFQSVGMLQILGESVRTVKGLGLQSMREGSNVAVTPQERALKAKPYT